ncbi:MAG: methionine--tRNA ligase [Candidatus Vogelbacteria bacterium]|nr:methionine--tRNA ligase [Candidatus Vogelbacteria bacterium]
MPSKIYLTTTLPYVNADPHIGFAAELVHADIMARYHLNRGDEVFFNTGTDEHGLKIYRQALAEKKEPPRYVDESAAKFKKLYPALGLWEGLNFIRTTDPHHIAAAQEFWRRCNGAGDIYKKPYQIKYCVGCELEKTESELAYGKCLLHPRLELEIIEEENYFFKFSKYQKPLLELYAARPNFVIPNFRFNEIKALVARGLEDFSISRLAHKMPWGVPVPDDPQHVIYVWFDALVNYISAIGWPDDEAKFKKWWPVIQFAGKDNLRQQAAMWQAMLLSANLPPSKQIIIRGFIQSGGQKMSKSLGNVIDPFPLVVEYGPPANDTTQAFRAGTDAVRYFLARHVNPFEDSDVTPEKIKNAYNANLANGLGNLVSRVMKMASDNGVRTSDVGPPEADLTSDVRPDQFLEKYEINKALDAIWSKIQAADQEIQKVKPFKLIKTDRPAGEQAIKSLLTKLAVIATDLAPFMPTTSSTIQDLIKENRPPGKSLFARK